MSHLIAAFDVSTNGNLIIWTDGNSLYKSDMDGEKMEVAFNYGNTFWHLFVLSFLQIYFTSSYILNSKTNVGPGP